jgi:glycosyltransferase involved in cell wall biosynthesis
MKTVFLRGRSQGGTFHSIYRELIRCPPDGYQILAGRTETQAQQQSLASLDLKRQLLYKVNWKFESSSYIRDIWHEARTLSYMYIKRTQGSRNLIASGADLVFSSQQLTFAKLPWVVDFEYANALADYGDIRLIRKFVQKQLGSKYCKKILPWSDWAKRTLYRSLDCGPFKEKVETVHFAVPKKDFAKKRKDDKLRLLFVGSINQFNFLNFEWKGGFEVVEAFLELSKKYDCLELVIRSWVPPEIIEKCADKPNIKIISSILSEEALAHLYASSDIFLFPSHLNLGMAILEAMSYELPVIAIDLYDTPEAVQNMKIGILIDPPSNVPYYIWNGAPNHYDKNLLPRIRQSRRWIVNQIVDKASLLIEESSLRRQIGREARRLTEQGEFSVARRNEKLKRIFDEAICAG